MAQPQVAYRDEDHSLQPLPQDYKTTNPPAGDPKGCNVLTCPRKGWSFVTILYLVIGILAVFGHLFSKGSNSWKIGYAIFALIWVIGFTFLLWYLSRHGKIEWAWAVFFIALIIQGVFLGLTLTLEV